VVPIRLARSVSIRLIDRLTGCGHSSRSDPPEGVHSPAKKVLGAGTIGELAKKAGIGESETTGALASLLPQVIDKISPGGKVPAGNDLGGALASLGKLLG
jgi:hypothetical protein